MGSLFQAHSGVRFLVLLAGVVALVLCGIGAAQKKPFTTAARIACTAFVGMMHLQVLLGIGVVVSGVWYAQLTGHVVLMCVATVLAQVLVVKNRKLQTPGYRLPLIGIGGALGLIVVGVLAIGRSPFGMTIAQKVG